MLHRSSGTADNRGSIESPETVYWLTINSPVVDNRGGRNFKLCDSDFQNFEFSSLSKCNDRSRSNLFDISSQENSDSVKVSPWTDL